VIIHQVAPILEPGAVGTHTLAARDALRKAGHTSEIYTPEVTSPMSHAGAYALDDYRGGADLLVYQLAIGNVAADFVAARREPLVVNYHNLTPIEYFRGWEPVAAWGVTWGRAQLRALAARATLGVAVSQYNEAELIEAGYSPTTVVPFLLAADALDAEPDPQEQERLIRNRSAAEWLFVGRLAPNKAQHDVVKSFAAYRRFHDSDARLRLVGGGLDSNYGQTLMNFVDALGLAGCVTFTGGVTREQLAAHYRTADVLVVCSEHEGFCVPLVEAMHHRLPVVAYAAAAVPETMGNAGVLLTTKDPCTVAAAVARVLGDSALRQLLVDAGASRVERFEPERATRDFVAAVEGAVAR
jgi:glycosyltransferase involved in cell wall biosynthesis